MGTYGLEQLFDDAIRRRGSTERGPPLNLKEVWAAVDRYTLACLEQKKGVCLPNLCRIGWQVVRLRNKCTHKPYFQLSESFCRAAGVDPGKGPLLPDKDLCAIEQFNFSKAAIKYSGALTKDHAFTGWRLLARQLSDIIGQGKSVCVEFSFGKLLANERDARFVFAADFYIAHGLEVPVGAADDIEYKPSATFSLIQAGAAQGLSLRGTGIREQVASSNLSTLTAANLSNLNSTDVSKHASGGAAATHGWAYLPEGNADVLTLCQDPTRSENPTSDHYVGSTACSDQHAPRRGWQGHWPADGSAASDPRANTYETALQTHISGLEALASEKIQARASVDLQIQQHLAEEAAAEAWKRGQRREHAASLQQQMKAKEHRKSDAGSKVGEFEESLQQQMKAKEQRQAEVLSKVGEFQKNRLLTPATVASSGDAKPGTGLTEGNATEGNPSVSGSTASQYRPNAFREALDEQVRAKQRRQNQLRAFEQRADTCMIEANKEEVATAQDFERVLKARERESLTAAWRDELCLKEMFKAAESDSGGRQPSSARRSSLGTPRSQNWPHSARGPGSDASSRTGVARRDPFKALYGLDSIGAAASLALQTKALSVV